MEFKSLAAIGFSKFEIDAEGTIRNVNSKSEVKREKDRARFRLLNDKGQREPVKAQDLLDALAIAEVGGTVKPESDLSKKIKASTTPIEVEWPKSEEQQLMADLVEDMRIAKL